MKIIIAGAGRVGTHLAKLFARENHNIIVLDENPDKLDALQLNYDLMAKVMSPTSIVGLKEIGVNHCDLFIGVTPDENLNINCCMMAGKLGARRTVARVDSVEYLSKQPQEFFKEMGISGMFIPEMVAAKEIVSSVERSWARMWWEPDGGDGNLALIGVKVRESCKILHTPLKDLPNQNNAYHVVAIKRGSETIIPHGDDIIYPYDLVFFMADKRNQDFIRSICGKDDYTNVEDVMIMGGGTTAAFTAQMLPSHMNVKIIEQDLNRCHELNKRISKSNVMVIHGDGRDLSLLQEENVDDADAFIALTPNSEVNIISCLTAKKFGVNKTVAMLDNINFIPTAESLDIGTLINKQAISASNIYRMILKADISNVKSLMVANADVAEFTATKDSKITKKLIKDLKLPANATLGGLIRKGKGQLINGMTQVQEGDKVVAICVDNGLKTLSSFFG
ncbi:MAG: Trk system potassium transporter TrkA [Prevotellaceae bacterium]|nr:Trk system potassium transporter TrkA [Prevotellaceae bacterium]